MCPSLPQMPRARSALQIYVAERYADDGAAKSVGSGLQGYLEFAQGCKVQWEKLTDAQRDTYQQLAAGAWVAGC